MSYLKWIRKQRKISHKKRMKIPHKKGQRNRYASPSRYAYYITEKGLLQMTNEELAMRIQRGETDLYSHLWARVEKLVALLAGRYYARSQVTCARSGVELEDLIQAGYFAMLDTVKSFDHKTGYKLTTYLKRHLLNQWAQMLDVRYGREKFDPLNRCTSLEKPIGGENEDIALGDVIPDKAAEQAIESSLERVYTQQLHDVLESCLDTLRPQEADTIRGRFYRGETLKQIAERQGCAFQYIRTLETNGLRSLRRGANLRKLKAWREDIIDQYAYKTGFGMFRQMGASSVEITVEKLGRRWLSNGQSTDGE